MWIGARLWIDRRRRRRSGELEEVAVEITNAEQVESEGEETVALGFGCQAADGLCQTLAMLGFLHAPELFALLPDLLGFEVEIDEDSDFGAQHFRNEGSEDVID